MNQRRSEREGGQLFSGHAKEEDAALVTRHTSVNMADAPFKCQPVAPRTQNHSCLFKLPQTRSVVPMNWMASLWHPAVMVSGMPLAFIDASSGNTQSI